MMESAETAPPSPPASGSRLVALRNWGTHPLPPACLATLILALHAQPVQVFPLLFAAPNLLASYLSTAGRPTDAAALSSAWGGLYALLAYRRREQPKTSKKGGAAAAQRWSFLSARGAVRGVAIGLGVANCVAGGWSFMLGDRDADERERVRRNRWGDAEKTSSSSDGR